MNAELIFGGAELRKCVRKPIFKNFIEFSDNCGLAVKNKREILMNSASPLAFSILSVSKLILLKEYYDVLEPSLRRHGAVTTVKYTGKSFSRLIERPTDRPTDRPIQ